MNCKSCALLIEKELSDLSYVEGVQINFDTKIVTVTGDFEGIPAEKIAEDFSILLYEQKYSFSAHPFDVAQKDFSDFKIAVPVALAFIVIFILLQKLGLVNIVSGKHMSFGSIFLIGVVASLSSCMAVVGGLLLSMSATFAKEGEKFKPQSLFHIGRLISFFIFGGVIGVIGSAFQLNGTMTFILGFIVGIVMLIMGLNLLDVFHITKKIQPSMPKFISRHALGISKLNHSLTPFLVGAVTFFLPCGFTQSMQIYTLSVGNFWNGGLTMLTFALGTLPILALVSFSSFSFKNNSKAGIFFKSAGLIVIFFAVFTIINSLVVINVLPPIFNF